MAGKLDKNIYIVLKQNTKLKVLLFFLRKPFLLLFWVLLMKITKYSEIQTGVLL